MPSTRRSTKSNMGMGTTGVNNPTTSGTASARRGRTRTRAGSTQGSARVGAGHEHITVETLVEKWQGAGAIAAEELPYARKFAGLSLLTLGF